MLITQLEVSNFKRVSAVNITPEGSIVVVSGNNGQGKTSTLDAIWAALGGAKALPKMPVRNGEKSGSVSVHLDGDPENDIPPLVVTRKFTADGKTSLEVKTREGFKPSRPQDLLDSLFNSITFDPLAFTRLKPKEQASELMALVGLDFSELDQQRQRAFDERTAINREVKSLKARLEAAEAFEDVPAEEVSVAELSEQLQAAYQHNEANREQGKKLGELANCRGTLDRRIDAIQHEIAKLQQELDRVQHERDGVAAQHAEQQALVDALAEIDVEPLREAMATAEQTNAKVRANKTRAEIAAQHQAKADEADALTKTISILDAEKQKRMSEAKWPIDGLGFNDDGVTLNGLPFEQASQAERLRASVAIGLAMSPRLRVLLLRDASLLDDGSMTLLAQIAKEHDAQLWLERVGDGGPAAVVIEDGQVKQVEPALA